MHRRRPSGLSLVEVMIAMVIGLLLLAGVYRVFLSTARVSTTTQALGDRQEAIRYVSARLAEDVRMAGFRGCLSDTGEIRNTLNPDPSISGSGRSEFTHADFRYRFERFAEGSDAGAGGWSPNLPTGFPTPRSGTDVLTVRGPVGTETYTVRDLATTSASLPIRVTSPLPLATGDIALISDCGGSTIFQVSGTGTTTVALAGGGTATLATLAHAATSAGSPGNWSDDLGRTYAAGAQLYRLGVVSFYIADSAQGGGPALWRRVDGDSREIAAGVDNLQVLYGEDSDGDGVADVYRRADQFADTAAWRRVAAIRVALLFSGTRDRAGITDSRSFDLLGVSVGPFTDGRLRRVVTLTLALRNRLP